MKKTIIISLALMASVIILHSCDKKTQHMSRSNLDQKSKDAEKIYTKFKSLLRPGEDIELGKIYTDTVYYVDFMDYTDDYQFVVKKNKDTIHLIYNQDNLKYLRGNKLEIKWKIDSIRPAGDPELLQYTEFLVSARKLKSKTSSKNFSDMKNRSFVISCGTGCALTHTVKNITRIDASTIKATFEVEMYINEEVTETFDDTYIFSYDSSENLKKVTREDESENLLETFYMGGAKDSFQTFGLQLVD